MRQALGLVLLAPLLAAAQSMEPRAYSNLPVGLNFLLVGYTYSWGDVGFDASSPLQDGHSRVHAVPVGYVRSLDVFGNAGSLAVVLPLVDMTATASLNGTSEARREVSGLGDPALRLAVNFFGAPALSAAEFAAYRQDLILGASLTVTAPLGQYDPERLVNIGTNRWSLKPELGLSKGLGPWTVELAGGVTWFTRNDEYFGGNTRSQDPVDSVQAHVTRQFGRGMWGALSTTYYAGGRTTLNGTQGNDQLAGNRVAATFSFPVDRRNSIKLSASSGLYARTGSEFETVGVIWQHVWGGGL
ncbi:MAG TPA: transporter [Burkholderiales bacterium]